MDTKTCSHFAMINNTATNLCISAGESPESVTARSTSTRTKTLQTFHTALQKWQPQSDREHTMASLFPHLQNTCYPMKQQSILGVFVSEDQKTECAVFPFRTFVVPFLWKGLLMSFIYFFCYCFFFYSEIISNEFISCVFQTICEKITALTKWSHHSATSFPAGPPVSAPAST